MKSRTAGTFITFEGIDGAGKSTHIPALAHALKSQGHAVTITREPGGTPLAEKIRSMVLNDRMDPLTETLLVFAARRDHLQSIIEPALARGEIVLCDRFTDSTFAYQGCGRGFNLDVLDRLERWVQTTLDGTTRQPDLTLWFDLDPAVAAKRLAGARISDRFEAESQGFFARVREGYLMRAGAPRFAQIAAEQPSEQVWQQVWRAVEQRGLLHESKHEIRARQRLMTETEGA